MKLTDGQVNEFECAVIGYYSFDGEADGNYFKVYLYIHAYGEVIINPVVFVIHGFLGLDQNRFKVKRIPHIDWD